MERQNIRDQGKEWNISYEYGCRYQYDCTSAAFEALETKKKKYL